MSKLYLFMTQDKTHLEIGIDRYHIWIEIWLEMHYAPETFKMWS